ncbi:MAG: CRISPR-associated endonuclease Cas2 [Chlorobium sp.]|nr:CRISPR-associated endonuclease Cas2 [Chlorobium sp.]MCW8819263.1 CRISPR-associated endonuclease Cas2 [Ignavibacteriaceae bacterium]
MFLLVSYDICDPKRLQRVAKLMERYGSRVQYSVFECLLTQRQQDALKVKLKKIIMPEEDSVRFYRLCEDCRYDIAILGIGEISQDEHYFIA